MKLIRLSESAKLDTISSKYDDYDVLKDCRLTDGSDPLVAEMNWGDYEWQNDEYGYYSIYVYGKDGKNYISVEDDFPWASSATYWYESSFRNPKEAIRCAKEIIEDLENSSSKEDDDDTLKYYLHRVKEPAYNKFTPGAKIDLNPKVFKPIKSNDPNYRAVRNKSLTNGDGPFTNSFEFTDFYDDDAWTVNCQLYLYGDDNKNIITMTEYDDIDGLLTAHYHLYERSYDNPLEAEDIFRKVLNSVSKNDHIILDNFSQSADEKPIRSKYLGNLRY